MKKNILSTLVILLCVVFAVSARTAPSSHHPAPDTTASDTIPRGPLLEVLDKNLDLGKIYPNSVRYGTIRFINAGDSALQLKSVRGNCGCTVVRFEKDVVEPDSIGTVSVKFDSHGRVPGKFRKMIRIRSNSVNGLGIAFISGEIITPDKSL